MNKPDELGGIKGIKQQWDLPCQAEKQPPNPRCTHCTMDALIERVEELERDAETYRKSQHKMAESYEAGLKSAWTVATRGWIFYHFEHAGNARWEKCDHCVCQTAYAECTQRHLNENALLKSVLDLKAKLQRYRELAERICWLEEDADDADRALVNITLAGDAARELLKEDG